MIKQDTSTKVNIQKEYIKKVNDLINRFDDKNYNNRLKYFIQTFGCSQNESDSELISGMLSNMGFEKTNDVNDSKIIVINTCCIRQNAEERLFGKLGEVKKLHDKGAIIALCGCMMQEDHIIEKLKKSYQFVDIIFGTHTLYKFPELLFKNLSGEKRLISIEKIDGNIYEDLPVLRQDNNSCNVTIMNGCNNFCTYCIVPYVRGRERSRNPKDIIMEVEELAKKGYKEVNLLGQNVNSYLVSENENNIEYEKYNGIDNFAKLLLEISKIKGIENIKFLSPHPKDFTDDVIDVIANNSNISKFIHLPLQSGSSNVLKSMNRKYSKEQYINLAKKMKDRIPNLKLSTDIIVGFPGETEEDFCDTLDVVKQIGFEQIFMFIYSRRVGTVADKMDNQIPYDIAHKRFARLQKLYEDQIDQNNKKYIGMIENVLVEGISKNDENYLTARNSSNKVLIFKGDKNLIGKIVKLEIISDHKWYLKAKIV